MHIEHVSDHSFSAVTNTLTVASAQILRMNSHLRKVNFFLSNSSQGAVPHAVNRCALRFIYFYGMPQAHFWRPCSSSWGSRYCFNRHLRCCGPIDLQSFDKYHLRIRQARLPRPIVLSTILGQLRNTNHYTGTPLCRSLAVTPNACNFTYFHTVPLVEIQAVESQIARNPISPHSPPILTLRC